jgi:hypothetical protein
MFGVMNLRESADVHLDCVQSALKDDDSAESTLQIVQILFVLTTAKSC